MFCMTPRLWNNSTKSIFSVFETLLSILRVTRLLAIVLLHLRWVNLLTRTSTNVLTNVDVSKSGSV